jgi:uncharacterized membrane protein
VTSVRRFRAFVSRHTGRWLALFYLAWALPFLFAIERATPPWQNSDEPLHLARAVQLAHGGLAGYRAWSTAGGYSDRAIYDAFAPLHHVAMHPNARPEKHQLLAADAVRWSAATQYTSFPNTAQYPPFFYLTDAASYWLGIACGMGIDATLHVARLANGTLFAIMSALALACARRARFLLAAFLMLPMTLSLAVSAAQDSLMIATTLLAVSLIDRAIAEDRAASRLESGAIVAGLAAVAMSRPPYAGFLATILALDPALTLRNRYRLLAAACAVALWCGFIAANTSVKLGGADAPAQLHLLLANPARIASITIETLADFTPAYWRQFIGVLGWTDTDLPPAYYLFASLVLLGTMPSAMSGPARRPGIAAAGVCFAILSIFVLQYLTWTWPGQPMVTGVLGRYFIPPAIVAALALPQLKQTASTTIDRVSILSLIAMAAVTPPVTLHALALRYAEAAP